MKNKMNKKVLGILLSMFLLIAVASAEDVADDTATASAGAQAIATGSEAIASTQVVITSESASASATAKAKAENGATATAIANAWATWVDGSSAYAQSMATAIAGIGETIWAEATAYAYVSADEAQASTEAYVGTDPNHVDDNDPSNGDNNNGGEKGNKNKIVEQDSIGGFIFGKGDIERYCHFKLQLEDSDTTNDKHARYYMGIIAWDYGFSELTGFENKYDIVCSSELDMKDRIP